VKAEELFRIAGGNLWRRKGRTTLTLIGVTIGVGALVVLVSLGVGLENQILKSFESEDVLRTITVTRVEGRDDDDLRFGAWGAMGQVVPITREEIAKIEALDGVDVAHPDLLMLLSATFPLRTPVKGKTQKVADGVPFSGAHDRTMARLESALLAGRIPRPGERGCLIPSTLLEIRFNLKPTDVALEQPLEIKARARSGEATPPRETLSFTITGIVDSDRLGIKRGQILLPLEQALELRDLLKAGYGGLLAYEKDRFPAVEVKTKRPEDVERVKNQLKNLGYDAMAAADMVKMINTTFLILQAFFACIGAIGLLISLFGIANTMAMAVLERTREIGIMKALGARGRDIRRLFLVEAVWIGMSGGVVGVGIGWILGRGLDALAHRFMQIPPKTDLFQVTPWLAGGAVVFSVLVSIVAGLIPAIRASRMDPVAALRYE